MYYDEAMMELRVTAQTGGVPLRMMRPVPDWADRWLEWRDGRIFVRFDDEAAMNARLCGPLESIIDRILSFIDLEADDWTVEEAER